jgi:hypothetical protein
MAVQPLGAFPSTSSKEELKTSGSFRAWAPGMVPLEGVPGKPDRKAIKRKAEETKTRIDDRFRIFPPSPSVMIPSLRRQK